jgi:hypothetical protein
LTGPRPEIHNCRIGHAASTRLSCLVFNIE